MFDESKIVSAYLKFCSNPLRTEAQIRDEYDALVHHPRIMSIGFYKPTIMMIGTDAITVNSNGLRRLIGQMIFFLVRKQRGGYWEVDFRFINATNPLMSNPEDGSSPKPTYMHPHISVGGYKPIAHDTGRLCIQRGQFDVYAAMRKGEIHVAAPRLIEILEVYPSGVAYRKAENWPTLEEMS